MERRQLARGRAPLRGSAGLALPLALALAACGGSSADFAARADAVCLERERAVAALRAPHNPSEALAVFERQVRLGETEADELAALDPPEGGDAALAGLVAEIHAELEAAKYLRVASLTGDIESAQGAYSRGRKAARRAHAYARRLGLSVCGRA